MRFGINTFLWTANFGPRDFGLLPAIKSHGFDGVEVTLIRQNDFAAGEIRRALQEYDLQATVCAVLPPELSLIADSEQVRSLTVAHLSDCIKLTAEAGASLIAGPLYAPVGYLPGRPPYGRRMEAGYRRLPATRTRTGTVLGGSMY